MTKNKLEVGPAEHPNNERSSHRQECTEAFCHPACALAPDPFPVKYGPRQEEPTTKAAPEPKFKLVETFCWQVSLKPTNASADTARVRGEFVRVYQGNLHILADNLGELALILGGTPNIESAFMVGPAVRVERE